MVSIIVPAYNAEKSIGRCIESVIKQTSSDFELIIVNDGSTDNTLNICTGQIENCQNAFIITQKNQGVSTARNVGIKKAKGEWIVFLDSDDYLDTSYVETIGEIAKNNTVMFMLFGFTTIGKQQSVQCDQLTIYNDNMMLVDAVMNKTRGKFTSASLNSPWAKAYLRNTIISNNIYFDDKINMGEDILFNLEYYLCINKFAYISRSMYNYQFSTDSLARKYDENLIFVDKLFHERLHELLGNQGLEKRYAIQTKLYVIDGYLSCLKRCLFHPCNKKSNRFNLAKELTSSAPYDVAIRDKDLIKSYCSKKDKMLISLALHNHWNLINFLINAFLKFKN